MSAITLGPDARDHARDTADSVKLVAGGSPVSNDWMSILVEVHVKDFWTQPDMALVRFHDPKGDKLASCPLKLGGTLTIEFGSAKDRSTTKIFDGEIVALEPEFREDGVHIAARAFDKGHRFNRVKRSEVNLNKKAEDIVRAAIGRSGVRAGRVDSTTTVHAHFQQSMETDWELCWRLARMNGFEFGVDDGQAFFRKRAASGPVETLKYMDDLISFRPRVSAVGQVSQVTVNSQDPKAKQPTTGQATNAPQGSGAPAILSKRAKAISDLGGGVALVADRVATSASEARSMAEGALARNAAAFLEAEGVAYGSPKLVAGATVKIDGVGDYSGNYVLSTTHHIMKGGGSYTTRFEITGDRPRSFSQLVGGGGAAGAVSGGGGASGDRSSWASQLVIALVTNSNDPDNMGRVKVKFESLGNNMESEWARVLTMGAGNSRGVFMMPQVNDTVVVGFEHGDPRRPFVLGTLYTGVEKLPAELKGPNREPMFAVKTPHQIFAQSDKELKLTSNEKMTIEVKNNPGELTVTADGDMKSDGKKNIKSTAAQNFEVTANSSVKIKGSGTVEIESSGQVKVKGSAVSIEGSGMVEIKGGMIKLG